MRTFWSFHASAGDAADAPALPAELRIDGEIADDDDAWWYEDGKVTCPDAFRAALEAVDGDLTVAINSPGGDVIAASCIYAMLREFAGRGHRVTTRIDGWAASAASVIAVAGDEVQMAPTAYMMIHDPWTLAMGNAEDMRACSAMLDEIADGIVEAYRIKTGMSRAHIRELMRAETWMSARKAVKLGFADTILYQHESMADDDGEAMQARAALEKVVARVRARAERRTGDTGAAHTTVPLCNIETDDTITHMRLRLMLLAAI